MRRLQNLNIRGRYFPLRFWRRKNSSKEFWLAKRCSSVRRRAAEIGFLNNFRRAAPSSSTQRSVLGAELPFKSVFVNAAPERGCDRRWKSRFEASRGGPPRRNRNRNARDRRPHCTRRRAAALRGKCGREARARKWRPRREKCSSNRKSGICAPPTGFFWREPTCERDPLRPGAITRISASASNQAFDFFLGDSPGSDDQAVASAEFQKCGKKRHGLNLLAYFSIPFSDAGPHRASRGFAADQIGIGFAPSRYAEAAALD